MLGHLRYNLGILRTLIAWSEPASPAPTPAVSIADTDTATGSGDISALDFGVPDTPVGRGACPGSPGCACASNEECSTGVCADSADTATGKACAFPFGSGCASAFIAVTAQVGEGTTVCVPSAPKLCNPFEKDDDCKATGGTGALCIDRGASGRFCGIACPAFGCPAGYACQDAMSIGWAKAQQCQSSEQTAGPVDCGCAAAAIGQKLATPCGVVGKDAAGKVMGTRAGQRSCGASGLGACAGKTAQAEACNGQDDDCNGKTDANAPCDNGLPCTFGDDCTGGTRQPGSRVVCNDKNDCTDDNCDPKSGKCVFAAVTTTIACDDGDPCASGEGCAGGVCQNGVAKACSGGTCTVGQCSKTSGQCQFADKPDGSPCAQAEPVCLGP